MKKTNKIIIMLTLLILVGVIVVWQSNGIEPKVITVANANVESAALPFTYNNYAAALKVYVNDEGMVNYAELKKHPEKLNAFLGALATLERQTYDNWKEREKIAFWVNAYNSLTLKAILENYPIRSSFFRSLKFPKNSIRQIPGVWDKLQFVVMGRKITLNEIEHKILRVKFDKPRIHMALVCAAMSCPPLRNEPYQPEKLDKQLDDQSRKFMSNTMKFKMDKEKNRVYLSVIFKWFGGDFVKKFKPTEGFADHKEAQRASLNFISRYLNENDAQYLKDSKYKIEYLDYDWTLNQQQKESQK
jgi:hypothetical protein